jgi:hypothetical protein
MNRSIGSGEGTGCPQATAYAAKLNLLSGSAMSEATFGERRSIPAGICHRQNLMGSPITAVDSPSRLT